MDRKIKLALAVSLLGFGTVACAPNPYWQYPGSGNYNRAARAPQHGVTHTHCGQTHTHVLPAQGLAHHHGNGCMAGAAPQNRPPPPPPPANTYPYNPPANNNPYTGSTFVDYSSYSTPKSGTNYADYGYNYNSTPPATTYTPPPPPPTTSYNGGDTYVVQKGDTVFQVMRNTGVYWKDIIRLNNLQAPDYGINTGQTLRLR
jgi:hypothetical protein